MDLPKNEYHVPRFMEESYNPLEKRRDTETNQAEGERLKPVISYPKISIESKLRRGIKHMESIVTRIPIPPTPQQVDYEAIGTYRGKNPNVSKLKKGKGNGCVQINAPLPIPQTHQRAEYTATEQSLGRKPIKSQLKKGESKSTGHISDPFVNSLAHQQVEQKAIERIKAKYVIDENGVLVTAKLWEKDHPVQKTVAVHTHGRSPKTLTYEQSIISKDIVACAVCSAPVRKRKLWRHFLKVHPNEPVRSVQLRPKR